MKKLLLLLATIACINAGAQVVPVITTTLTPGTGDFLVDKSHYPFNTFFLNIVAKDTGLVGLNYTLTGNVFINAKPRVKYIDGRTGLPFVSIGRLQQFYDSFMVATVVNNIAGSLTVGASDATAANQVIQIARLDSLAKFATNKGITATSLGAADTLAIPAGSLLIGGVLTSSAAIIGVGDITGETATEQHILSAHQPAVPFQAYRSLATAHTITATNACTVFVLKLN